MKSAGLSVHDLKHLPYEKCPIQFTGRVVELSGIQAENSQIRSYQRGNTIKHTGSLLIYILMIALAGGLFGFADAASVYREQMGSNTILLGSQLAVNVPQALCNYERSNKI